MNTKSTFPPAAAFIILGLALKCLHGGQLRPTPWEQGRKQPPLLTARLAARIACKAATSSSARNYCQKNCLRPGY